MLFAILVCNAFSFVAIAKKISIQLDLYLHRRADRKIKDLLKNLSLEEIVSVINSFPRGKKKLFNLLDPEIAAEVFLHLNESSRHAIQKTVTKQQIQKMILEMNSDDLVDFIKSFPEFRLQNLLDIIPEEILPEVKKLLRYPADTAGGLMQTELIALPKNLTIKKAIETLRKNKDDVDDIHNIYIINSKNQLIGSLNLDELIFAKPQQTLAKVMDKNPLYVTLKEDQEKVAHVFREHNLISLPVVNSRKVLMGCIMVDDIIDVIEQEHSEDMYRMAGIQNEEHIHDPALLSIRRRIPWLILNLGTVFLIATVVGMFAGTIEKLAILAAYMPVVAGLGGNAATQGVTVMVRGMAMGDVNFAEARGVVFKETLVGLTNGLIIGSLVGLIAFLINQNPLLGAVIGLAIWINLILAGLLGVLIPFSLKKLKIDPALASSIFITACTDTLGFFVFLELATLILI